MEVEAALSERGKEEQPQGARPARNVLQRSEVVLSFSLHPARRKSQRTGK